MEKMERRYRPIQDIEIREVQEGEEHKLEITGYPIVYGQRTVLFPGLVEVIEPGAATEALEKKNTQVFWNHDTAKPMASFKNGTLETGEDEHGVWMRAEVSGSVWGREGHEAIKNKLVDQMSFAFRVTQEGESWDTEKNEDGSVLEVRTIKKFEDILDFSPVTEPAYPTTEVYARSKEVICRNKPDSGAPDEGSSAEELTQTPTEILREQIRLKEEV
jgi:HK97 family phage prohead protease